MDSPNQTTPDLYELIDLFFDDPAELASFEEISVDELPLDYQSLLAHDQHMTVTIEKYHGCRAELEVLEEIHSGDYYSRKILLRRSTDHRIVQYGIVRLDLSVLDSDIRDQIQNKQTPLGRILIENEVLRKVRLASTWHVTSQGELARYLGLNERTPDCFGRTALIYCNDKPAVQLLEIVVD